MQSKLNCSATNWEIYRYFNVCFALYGVCLIWFEYCLAILILNSCQKWNMSHFVISTTTGRDWRDASMLGSLARLQTVVNSVIMAIRWDILQSSETPNKLICEARNRKLIGCNPGCYAPGRYVPAIPKVFSEAISRPEIVLQWYICAN